MTTIRKTVLFLVVLALTAPASRSSGKRASLDGVWDFAVDSTGSFTIESIARDAHWRQAKVPLSWQAQFPDLRDYQGVAWYRRSFVGPQIPSGGSVTLHFGAVDYRTDVFVNGRLAGRHEGGYTPFEVDVTRHLRKGTNELTIRVMDPVETDAGTEGINYENIPHGKQSWYVQTSGIWQSVSLSIGPPLYIKSARITPSLDGHVVAGVDLNAPFPSREAGMMRLLIQDPDAGVVFAKTFKLPAHAKHVDCQAAIPKPILWSPASPSLYTAFLSLGKNPPEEIRFGFRTIGTKDGDLLLNGEPFFLIGALDQDFYPETIYTVPSEEVIRDEMRKAKEMGLNALRCHIKVPDPIYLKVADEVGMLVWYEIPNWDVLTPEAADRAMQTLAGMVERDWNHPSLVIISLINESWGIDLKDSVQRSWLKRSFSTAKELAPGRLIVDNSACWGNFHVKTDINDYHTYWAIPETRNRFDETVRDFSTRPAWLFSPFGDAEQTWTEPLILSEFGNWGLPAIPDPQPWWIDRRFGDAYVVFPKDFKNRIREYHYEGVFGTYDGLIQSSQVAQYEALKHEIETIRMSPALRGYVITEFTDINWESNGLLDMWRQKKFAARHLAEIQQQDVIIPRPENLSCWVSDTVEIPVWISHFSGENLDGSELNWNARLFGESGRISIAPEIHRGTVTRVADLKIPAKELPGGSLADFIFEIVRPDGLSIARNSCTVFVAPTPRPQFITNPLYLHDPSGVFVNLNSALPQSGSVLRKIDARTPMVTTILDNTVLRQLETGGTVLCVADSSTRLPSGFPIVFAKRDTGWYDGNWASNLNWVRPTLRVPEKNAVWDAFSSGRVDSTAFSGIVMKGIPPAKFDDVLAGMFVGWLHLNSAYIVQMNVGKGKLLLTTLPAVRAIGSDPFATTLFAALLEFAWSEKFRPAFTWKLPFEGQQ